MNSYKLIKTTNKAKYEKIISDAIEEFSGFFGFKLERSLCLIFLNSHQKFNDINGRETPAFVTGYSAFNLIFFMEEKNYSQESHKKFDPIYYQLSLRHEVCHSFFRQLAWKKKPVWLSEGVCLYLSGQIEHKPPIKKFTNFLNFYEDEQQEVEGKTVYQESGFVVEKLINKLGKEKLMEIIKSLRKINNKDQFEQQFKQIYGFELSYDNINHL